MPIKQFVKKWWGIIQMDQLSTIGYINTKGLGNIKNNSDDGEEIRRGLWMKNGDLINCEAVLKLLKVELKGMKYHLPSQKVLSQ